ncbi:hypothetical protein QQZ08_008378 [Neonectria magnoliae]|uniref:Uncharacterized protein n=1 Tax=Neonectria magnoliae TaxID=2732573 RepID=A0ABR1HVX9_9HYPO
MADVSNGSTTYNTPLVPPPEGVESNFDVGWANVQVWTVVMFGILKKLEAGVGGFFPSSSLEGPKGI